MVFPIIPILAIAALVGGVGTLVWCTSLPKSERESADQRANEIAMDVLGEALDRLTSRQAKEVLARVRHERSV